MTIEADGADIVIRLPREEAEGQICVDHGTGELVIHLPDEMDSVSAILMVNKALREAQ